MGILDELDRFNELHKDAITASTRAQKWDELCVCGHLKQHHGPSIGGTFPKKNAATGIPQTLTGCTGGQRRRGEPIRYIPDPTTKTLTVLVTCDCPAHRPVARVDRGGVVFRQRGGTSPEQHPLMIGLRALRSRLGQLKSVSDPEAEFERRFEWVDDARRCAICGTAGDGVWPIRVDGSDEMRCARHPR